MRRIVGVAALLAATWEFHVGVRRTTDAIAVPDAEDARVDHPDEQPPGDAGESRAEVSRARAEEQRSEHAHLRAAENHELFSIRRVEARMTSEVHALEHGLEQFEASIQKVEIEIQEEWRAEHWGRPSPPPPGWPASPPPHRRRGS